MAFTLQIDPDQGIERAVYSGVITEDDLAGAWRAIDAHPDHRLSHHLVTDLRLASLHAITVSAIREIAAGAAARYHSGLYRQGRVSILVGHDDQEVTGRLIKLYIDHLELLEPEIADRERLFSDEEKALAWLRSGA